MKYTLIFPTCMIALSLGSAVMYAVNRQWWQVVYWISATALTTSVTFGKLG